MSGGSGYSLAERVLGAALLLLLAALAVRAAVHIILSVLWPLVGLVAFGLTLLAGWRLWQAHRGGW